MIRAIRRTLSRLVTIFRKSRLDRDFDEELSSHIELLTDQNRRRGLPNGEARRQAILQMGGLAVTSELHRAARGLPRLEHVAQACAQAWRSWRNAKGVALLASAALAVGIGSATAIYTVVNAAMLKPLPYSNGDRMVALFVGDTQDAERRSPLRSQEAEKFRDRLQAFETFGWFRGAGKNLMLAGEAHFVSGVAVTVPLVQDLGVAPAIGRWFDDESSVVLSRSLWQRLGGSPAILGQVLTLDGLPYTVSGVMPESFRLPVAGLTSTRVGTDVWIPLSPRERAGAVYFAYARLRPNVSIAAAEDEVRRVAAEIVAEDPRIRSTYTARVLPLPETVFRQVRPTLLLLLAASGIVFLITCANAAGLLLARSVARAPEAALRVALGAGTGRLAVHYLAENLLVAVAGGVGGVLLSIALTPMIVTMAADYVPRVEEISVDWSVMLFAVAAAVLATVLSSIAPLWQASRIRPADVLADGVRSSAGARTRRTSQSLVVAEIALAFALLAVSAALILHVRNLARTPAGFDPSQVLTFGAGLPGDVASDPARRIPLQRGLLQALAAIPGVEAVGFANQLPMKGCCWPTAIFPENRSLEMNESERTSLMAASAGYFRAMRIRLITGRLFTDDDVLREPGAIPAVINQAAANRYWPNRDPVGQYGRFDSATGTRFEVVGVVADVKNDGLGNPAVPEIYRPGLDSRVESMLFAVRSARPQAALVADLRRAVQTVDPTLPIRDVVTMQEIIQRTMTLERAALFLTTFFAGAALLMAMLGVYGVVSYSVRQRTVEIGMRMALGATGTGVLSLIVGSGLRMAVYGVIAGGAAAIGAAHYLRTIFEMGPIGPAPFLYSAVVVGAVAFTASVLPAWRATLMSPLVAIRNRA